MNKDDLKNGMMVVLDNKQYALVVKDADDLSDSILYQKGFDYLDRFHENLTCDYGRDIIEVYTPNGPYALWQFFEEDYRNFELIWERESPKKKELEKKLLELEKSILEIKNELSELN